MDTVIAVIVLIAIVGLALWYVIRAKKSGKKCIGCPEGSCPSKKGEEGACCCCNKTEE